MLRGFFEGAVVVLRIVVALEPLAPLDAGTQYKVVEWVADNAIFLVQAHSHNRGRDAIIDLTSIVNGPLHDTFRREWPTPGETLIERVTTYAAKSHGETHSECIELVALRDDLAAVILSTLDKHISLEILPLFERVSDALACTSCCQQVVQHPTHGLLAVLNEIVSTTSPWRFFSEYAMLWSCLEYVHWGWDGWSGIHHKQWNTVLNTQDHRLYVVTDALTAQLAFSPLSLARAFRAPHAQNNIRTRLTYVIDHHVAAGFIERAKEIYRFACDYSITTADGNTAKLVGWKSFYNTDLGYSSDLSLASWPWWQMHPNVVEVINLMETHFDIIANERPSMEGHAQLEKPAYSINDRSTAWTAINFIENFNWSEDQCKLAPQTCEVFRRRRLFIFVGRVADTEKLGFAEKVMWTVVAPHSRFTTHSGEGFRINVQICVSGCDGAVLHVNGTTTPYMRGKAIAWQDSFRHEVSNDGDLPRWVFQVTIAHPDLRLAWAEENGNWTSIRQHLADVEESTVALLSRATTPYSRLEML